MGYATAWFAPLRTGCSLVPTLLGQDLAAATAHRLAALLDAADFAGAAALLHPKCVYHFRGKAIEGPAAIIASYERAHADALATFDAIAYESEVRPIPPGPHAPASPLAPACGLSPCAGHARAKRESVPLDPHSAVIHYTDILTHHATTHRHHCAQRITVGPAEGGEGLITRIEHIDLPGEHEALNAFLASVGLPSRPALSK